MISPQTDAQSYEHHPPRPYSWKTDEFQVSETSARKTTQINQVQPLNNQNTQMRRFSPPVMSNQAMMQTGYRPAPMNYNYRCPNCGTQNFPYVERKISTAGWITFAVLLVFAFPLFWIGLLIKEDVKVCPVCRIRLNF